MPGVELKVSIRSSRSLDIEVLIGFFPRIFPNHRRSLLLSIIFDLKLDVEMVEEPERRASSQDVVRELAVL